MERFRLNVWRSRTWIMPSTVSLFCGITGIAFIANAAWTPAAILAGLFLVGTVWWYRAIRHDRVNFPLKIYAGGFAYDNGTVVTMVRFSEVAEIREERLSYGIGPWNQETVWIVRTIDGSDIWIGNRLVGSSKIGARLTEQLQRNDRRS